MTTHMIRLFISQDADDVLIQPQTGFIAVWLSNHEAWTVGRHDGMPTLQEPLDGSESYYAADWRFQWSESKELLTANLTGHVEPRSPWHRLGYHECTHDETDGGPCSWDDSVEAGTVPSHVTTFETG